MPDYPPQIRERTVAKARILLEALPYMKEHFGQVVVVKYGGAAMAERALALPFVKDIALLSYAGIIPVIVHGGGPQLTEVSSKMGLKTKFVGGLRVTDDDTLDVAKMVLAGKLNKDVVALLEAGGVPAVGLSGVDGGLLIARKKEEPDLGFVGEITEVRPKVVRDLMNDFVPVIASIATDEHGQVYNVNADLVAAELAMGLGAEKLVYILDVPGLIDPDGELLSELGVQDALDLMENGSVDGGMVPKLESSVRAVKEGVKRVHLIDGRVEHSLVLELFTPEGVGSMITPEVTGAGKGV
ncbi:MAG: acetylglutamate kinase [Actinomycetota bacterium]